MNVNLEETSKQTRPFYIRSRYLRWTVVRFFAFADDVRILIRTPTEIQINLILWSNTFRKYGMKLNISKRRIKTFAREAGNLDIMIGQKKVEQIKDYQYLEVGLGED